MSNNRSSSWRRLRWMAMGVGLSALLWSGSVTVIWLFLVYKQGFKEASWSDMCRPGHWPSFRRSLGDHYIAKAGLLTPNSAESIHLLRAGLTKSPANATGRLRLAAHYELNGLIDRAADVLASGLPMLDQNPAYVEATLSFFVRTHNDPEVDRLTSALLAKDPVPHSHSRIAIHAAAAAYRQGDNARAEALLRRHRLITQPDGLLLQARIDWAQGLTDLALQRVTCRLESAPQDLTARSLLTTWYRELGQNSAWAASVVAMLASDPLSPTPRISYLQLLNHQGQHERMRQAARDFVRLFAHDPEALLLLAGFAASSGQPEIARQVQTGLASTPALLVPSLLFLAEAHLTTGEYPEALRVLQDLIHDHPGADRRTLQTVRGLQAVACYGQGHLDEGQLYLDGFLSGTKMDHGLLLVVADQLDAAGATVPARHLLEYALAHEPFNQAALTRLLDAALGPDGPAAFIGLLDRYLR